MNFCEKHSRTRNAAGECLACDIEKATLEAERVAFRFAATIGVLMAGVLGILIWALWGAK